MAPLDFTTRMFLRDYAAIESLHRTGSHVMNFQFASYATSTWITLVLIVMFNVLCFASRGVIPLYIQPWSAPSWVLITELALLIFGTGYYIDRKLAPFKDNGRPAIVDEFRTPKERIKWWASLVAIPALCAALYLIISRAMGR